ncbi:MAG: glycerophosphodiester phosphodiesterase, partial [Acholeplasmatales bacterium]|nr:glycerophosphodiester phosphodiesterase [Acholeplasmatales bacterium]
MKKFIGKLLIGLLGLIVMVIGLAYIDFENRDSHVKAIAHRGYSADAPENTLVAYRLAKEKGFSYVECDISFTKDGVA